MNDFLPNLFNLLRLRSGPQDLPSSWPLTIAVIAIYLGEGILTSQQLEADDNAARTILSSIIQIGAVVLLLRFRRRSERLAQTLLAFTGTGVILGMVAFIFLLQADPAQNQPLLALGWFVIFGWSLAIDAHIYRHALDVSMSMGMLLAVGLLGLTYVVMQLLFMSP